MQLIGYIGAFLLGAAAAAFFFYLAIRGRLAEWSTLREERATMSERITNLQAKEQELVPLREERDEVLKEAADLRLKLGQIDAQLAEKQKGFDEMIAKIAQNEQQLKDAFAALANDAVRKSQEDFLELAATKFKGLKDDSVQELEKRKQAIENLVKPIDERLGKLDELNREMEKERAGAYKEIGTMVKNLMENQGSLEKETRNLVKALRNPTQRGQWGEIQLRRVVEMAGMTNYVDFVEQESVTSNEGARQRPDLVVKLPNDRKIVVDAKSVAEAYLRAVEAESEEERRALMKQHARQVRDQVNRLGQKAYTSQFEFTPDFVVLFLPGEPLFSAALEEDPSLIEFGVQSHVLIATPITLIALLRTIATGWRQEQLSDNARRIAAESKMLYDSISTFSAHYAKVRKNLETAVGAFNDSVGSLERNVLPKARRIRELGNLGGTDLAEISAIDTHTRAIQAPELQPTAAVSSELAFEEVEPS